MTVFSDGIWRAVQVKYGNLSRLCQTTSCTIYGSNFWKVLKYIIYIYTQYILNERNRFKSNQFGGISHYFTWAQICILFGAKLWGNYEAKPLPCAKVSRSQGAKCETCHHMCHGQVKLISGSTTPHLGHLHGSSHYLQRMDLPRGWYSLGKNSSLPPKTL